MVLESSHVVSHWILYCVLSGEEGCGRDARIRRAENWFMPLIFAPGMRVRFVPRFSGRGWWFREVLGFAGVLVEAGLGLGRATCLGSGRAEALEGGCGVWRFRGSWCCMRRSRAALERPKGEDDDTMVGEYGRWLVG